MKKLITFIFLLSALNSIAQKEANIWYFGENAGLDFKSGSPVPITDGKLNTREGCSSISDKNGNLLFYSDGTTVWSSDHTVMQNGQGLLGNASSTQSAIIVPHPGNPDHYFLFTVGANVGGRQSGFNYYVVDISMNGGLGEVIQGPVDLAQGRSSEWSEKVAAIKGNECNTFWVVSYVVNEFFAYKISSTRISANPVRTVVPFSTTGRRGYLKLSPNGKKLALAHMSSSAFLLYDFDDVTGKVSNERNLPLIAPTNKPYGVEFSANSEKLYVHASNDFYSEDFVQWNNPSNHFSTLYQFNLSLPTTAEIVASRTVIDSRNLYRGGLQLGPDQKIYRALSETYDTGMTYLGVIENPENEGLTCNYKHLGIMLGGKRSSQGLPPFLASIFSQIEIKGTNPDSTTSVINDQNIWLCKGDSFEIISEPLSGSATYNWYFNGNKTPFSNSPNLSFPNVTNALNGKYLLIVENKDICGIISTLEGEFSLNASEIPVASLPPDIIVCDDDDDGTFPFDLTQQNAIILNSQKDVEVSYYISMTDAENELNVLPIPFNSGSSKIYARIQNVNNSNCFDITSFDIYLYNSSLPQDASSISSISVCDDTSFGSDTDGYITVDLTQKEIEILNNQNSSDFDFTYYTDINYTIKIPNPTTFKNTVVNGQTIYVRISNKLESSCSSPTSFNIEIFELPEIESSLTLKQCDEDGTTDGFTDFNLNEANEYLTLGDSSLQVTYHLTSNDANNDINNINASPFSNKTQNTVYARIETENDCHRTAQINLMVSATSFPDNYVKIMINCDDDNTIDGLNMFDLSLNDTEIINLFPTGQNLGVSYFRNLNDAQLEENKIPKDQHFMNEIPFNQIIYVRVESMDNGACFGIGPYLELVVNSRPEFELDVTDIYCQNLSPITVSTYNPSGDFTYEWKDESGTIISSLPEAIISEEGIYSVIATSVEGCPSFPHTINIEPSIIASITENDILIYDDSVNNSITIETGNLGVGDYEFALNDISGNYQDEPFFENILPGIYTLFIRDKNHCGIAQIDVPIIGYPNFFTPNNDGVNDTWKVLGVNENFYTSSKILIFDRFGKLITQIDPKGDGWSGIFNGQYLPATDYWFSVELIDNKGNIRFKKGHFSLIRK